MNIVKNLQYHIGPTLASIASFGDPVSWYNNAMVGLKGV